MNHIFFFEILRTRTTLENILPKSMKKLELKKSNLEIFFVEIVHAKTGILKLTQTLTEFRFHHQILCLPHCVEFPFFTYTLT